MRIRPLTPTTAQSTHGLIAKAPKSLLEREIKLDLRQLGKALVGGTTDALRGDWFGAARRLGEGFIGGSWAPSR